jgi:hypothetical protein
MRARIVDASTDSNPVLARSDRTLTLPIHQAHLPRVEVEYDLLGFTRLQMNAPEALQCEQRSTVCLRRKEVKFRYLISSQLP